MIQPKISAIFIFFLYIIDCCAFASGKDLLLLLLLNSFILEKGSFKNQKAIICNPHYIYVK